MREQILVVEDEAAIRDLVRLNLERQGFKVSLAASGEEALEQVRRQRPDLVVLDIQLPGIDGLEVCRRLQASPRPVPVLMLTARSDDLDKILGLELGADDYLTKPFNPRELIARIRAVLRRTAAREPAADEVQHGPLFIDLGRRKVRVRGERVELTPREFDLLACLAAEPGRVFSRDQLLNQVWGRDYFGDPKTVDVHVRRLREKVEVDAANPSVILTVWGVGYRLGDA